MAERVLSPDFVVRDAGLLESALARPQAVLFGEAVYPRIADQTAALLHSACQNHTLIDGNKRLSLAASIAFLGMNGRRLTLTNDEAYDLVIAVASGEVIEAARSACGRPKPSPDLRTGWVIELCVLLVHRFPKCLENRG